MQSTLTKKTMTTEQCKLDEMHKDNTSLEENVTKLYSLLLKKERHIPAGYTQIVCNSLVQVYGDTTRNIAIAFKGKKTKPVWHMRFLSQESMNKRINDLVGGYLAWEEKKAQRKEERKVERAIAGEQLKIGDIFNFTWGYEQTNQDFYQIVEIKGRKMVLQEIKANKIQGENYDQGYCTPIKDAFVNEETITVACSFRPKIASYGCASLHKDGETYRWSSYA